MIYLGHVPARDNAAIYRAGCLIDDKLSGGFGFCMRDESLVIGTFRFRWQGQESYQTGYQIKTTFMGCDFAIKLRPGYVRGGGAGEPELEIKMASTSRVDLNLTSAGLGGIKPLMDHIHLHSLTGFDMEMKRKENAKNSGNKVEADNYTVCPQKESRIKLKALDPDITPEQWLWALLERCTGSWVLPGYIGGTSEAWAGFLGRDNFIVSYKFADPADVEKGLSDPIYTFVRPHLVHQGGYNERPRIVVATCPWRAVAPEYHPGAEWLQTSHVQVHSNGRRLTDRNVCDSCLSEMTCASSNFEKPSFSMEIPSSVFC